MFVELLQRLRPLRGLPIWLRYGLTAVIVLACFGLRYLLGSTGETESLPLYLMFMPAVIVASFAFDRGSGFFAVLLSAVLGLYFFIEPYDTFEFHNVGEVARLIVFTAVGLLTAAIIEALRRTVDELAERTGELEEARRQLARDNQLLAEVDTQKTLFLADINHRVKNHLQSISGMLGVSARRAGTREEAQAALRTGAVRLEVLGRVYDRLHLSRNHAVLDAQEFITGLCADLKATIGELRPISVRVDVESGIELEPNRAAAVGLIINELLTNALKYAFPDEREGNVDVSFRRQEGNLCLLLKDDGVGFVEAADGERSTGTRLIRALARQLGGTAIWQSDGGTKVVVTLPDPQAHQRVF